MTLVAVIEEQLRASNRLLEGRAAGDPVCSRLMSVPGVGPIAALTFTASVEDPHRFARSEDVGAYAGLVPRRSQSGERDVRGHISKAGDPMLRRSLYEAANIMLCRVQRPFALVERDGVSLGMTPVTFFPVSHARVISPGL